jgi:molybdopterin-guanine dinucleotide biosynthesis protein A
MGRDKAWLDVGGRPLLARQIALVRELAPAEVFISGREDADYAALGCPVLRDAWRGAGPLAGIAAGLAAASAPLVLVLAVDLPAMRASVLQELASDCAPDCGVVPKMNQQWEPLVAFYPRTAAVLAQALLRRGVRAARIFADRCQRAGLVVEWEVPASLWACFANWNTPADLCPNPKATPAVARCGERGNAPPVFPV